MTHVLDSGERANLRKYPQTIRRNLCFVPESVVWTGRVNGSPLLDAQTAGIYGFPYDGESGTPPGLNYEYTVYIGTVAGGRDIGKFRYKSSNTTGKIMYVNETAFGEVPVENDYYITMTDQRRIWQKRIHRVVDETGINYTEYVDYNISYYDQNTDGYPGIINITRDEDGNPYLPAGRYDAGQNYRTIDLSAALSFLPKNPGAMTFTWNLPAGVTLAPGYDDNDVSIKVRATQGCHEIRLLMQYGGVYGIWRSIYVWAFPIGDDSGIITNFRVVKDEREDGREMDFDILEDIPESLMPEGTMVCYWEEDINFGGSEAPDSYISQYIGWTLRDATLLRLYRSRYQIQTGGPMSVLDRIGGYPQTFYDPRTPEDPHGTPTKFIEMPDNTPDIMVHTLLGMYTNVLQHINLYFSDYQVPIEGITLGDGSIKAQLNSIVERYFGFAACDSVGSMYLRRHFAYLTDEERLDIDAIITVGKEDWDDKNAPDFIEEKSNRVRQLDLYGTNYDIQYDDDDNLIDFSKIWHSVAPGIVQSDGISFESGVSVFLKTTQASKEQLDFLSGRHYARLNNKRPDITLQLKGNFDFVEPAWGEPVRISYTDDNVRGTSVDGRAFLVKRVSVQHSMDVNQADKKVSWTLEQVTGGDAGTNIPAVSLPETEPYPEPEYNPIPEWDGENVVPTKLVALDAHGSKFARASLWNPSTGYVDWEDASTGLTGSGIWLTANPFDYRCYFALMSTGLFRCNNVWAGSPAWSQVATNAQMFGGDASGIGLSVHMSINRSGWIAVPTGYQSIAISFDYGDTWQFTQVNNTAGSAGTSLNAVSIGIAVSPYNNGDEGWIYAGVGYGYMSNERVYKSVDWGQTWSLIASSMGGAGGVVITPRLNIPYIKSDGTTPNINDSSQELWATAGAGHSANVGVLIHSVNAGVTWANSMVTFGAGVISFAGSICGSPIQTFTWNGARVQAAGLATGAGGDRGALLITNDAGSTFAMRQFVIPAGGNNASFVNGFPLHQYFSIWWNRQGVNGGIRWTFDDGATSVVSGTMPSFFTDTGGGLRHAANVQADLSDYVSPAA